MPNYLSWCIRLLVRCGMPLGPASHKVFGGAWGGTTIIGGTAKRELTAYEGRALATSNSSGDQFVGRGEVIASLSELLTSSKERNQAAYIVGEPGVGKTRLVEVLAEAAREAKFQVVWGRPQQYAEDFPLPGVPSDSQPVTRQFRPKWLEPLARGHDNGMGLSFGRHARRTNSLQPEYRQLGHSAGGGQSHVDRDG